MNLVGRLLRKNTSAARVAGFVVSNFIGLTIILGALQFYLDAKGLLGAEGSFIDTDYMVINKRVTSENLLGGAAEGFTADEIAELERQPWVRKVGAFSANDFRVSASVGTTGRSMSTDMFFEAIPDEFVDVPDKQWMWRPGQENVPIVIPKDYLTLYNFGFATSAGLPQMSEGIMSGIPMTLTLSSRDGSRVEYHTGYVAGYSNRLNTILVPSGFLEDANSRLGSGEDSAPQRLIIDVSSPGDVAIAPYLEERGWEPAGDKSSSGAAFLLKVVTGIVIIIGVVITLLSFFILMLSISLIMEKNRWILHKLLQLGYPLGRVSKPYVRLIIGASAAAFVLSLVSVFLLRGYYLGALSGLGSSPGAWWIAPLVGLIMTLLIIFFNMVSVGRRVRSSWISQA